MDEIYVSINCVTYNHEKYVAQALDGMLMQITTFPFEILIHDDASTDGTADIIRSYASKYPDIVKPIFQTENQYSKGVNISGVYNFPRAKGKYIALCEGDDYWTDVYKLQKQVEFLDKHPDFIAAAHNISIVNEEGTVLEKRTKERFRQPHIYGVEDALKLHLIGHTASFVFRNIFAEKGRIWEMFLNTDACGDLKLSCILGSLGKVMFLEDNMSCYRWVYDHGTSWTAAMQKVNSAPLRLHQHEEMAHTLKDLTGITPDIEVHVRRYVVNAFLYFLLHPSKENWMIFYNLYRTKTFHKLQCIWDIIRQTVVRMIKKVIFVGKRDYE